MSVYSQFQRMAESCSCALHGSGVCQTLDELEFERGIWQAAKDGEEDRVRRLLRDGSVVNTKDSSGYTALHYACRSGQVTICQLLISSSAHLNCQTPGGATGLHRAAYCGHGDVVRLLVREGADGGVVDGDGRAPLHKSYFSTKTVSIPDNACEGGKMDVAELLAREFPETCHMRDKRGNLPRDLVTNWTHQWEHTLGNVIK